MTHEEWTKKVVESLRHRWDASDVGAFAEEIKVKLKDTPQRNDLFTQDKARRRVDKLLTTGQIDWREAEIENKKIDNAIYTILSELKSNHILPFESLEEEENFQRSVREFIERPKH